MLATAARRESRSPTCACCPRMANRHGLIAGATGTGKTVTLQSLAERFSAHRRAGLHGRREGRPRRASASAGGGNAEGRASASKQLGLDDFAFAPVPVVFWDVFGEQGHPVRATISEMGPLLLAPHARPQRDAGRRARRSSSRSPTTTGLLLLDLKDLRAMLQYVGDNAAQFTHAVRQRLAPPASAPSSAACSRSSSRAATSSSASRRSTSTT